MECSNYGELSSDQRKPLGARISSNPLNLKHNEQSASSNYQFYIIRGQAKVVTATHCQPASNAKLLYQSFLPISTLPQKQKMTPGAVSSEQPIIQWSWVGKQREINSNYVSPCGEMGVEGLPASGPFQWRRQGCAGTPLGQGACLLEEHFQI